MGAESVVGAEVERRGMIRPISDLPASPGGAEIIEVEIARQFYKRNVPSASYFNQTVVQLPLASAGFPDDCGQVVTVNGPVTLDTTTTPFSAKFSAGASSNQGIHIAEHTPSAFQIGASPIFTIEGWFKSTQTQALSSILARDNGSGSNGSYSLFLNNSTADGKLAFYTTWGAGSPAVISTLAYNDGVRHHCAIVHIGVMMYLYVDGSLVGATITGPLSFATTLNAEILLGGAPEATRQFVGNLDNWRIVNGVAVYAGPRYTVPTEKGSSSSRKISSSTPRSRSVPRSRLSRSTIKRSASAIPASRSSASGTSRPGRRSIRAAAA